MSAFILTIRWITILSAQEYKLSRYLQLLLNLFSGARLSVVVIRRQASEDRKERLDR